MSADFVEADGYVHVLNPVLSEFTLCGDAFDAGDVRPGYEQRATKKRRVTCPTCATIIRNVRHVQCAALREPSDV